MKMCFAMMMLLCMSFGGVSQASSPDGNMHSTQPTRIMVLATPHLTETLAFASLQPLIDALIAYAPSTVAIEALPAEILEDMLNRGGLYAQIADQFAGTALELGMVMQQHSGISSAQARQQAAIRKELSGLTVAQRLLLIADMLSSYQFNNAALHWRYLSPEQRQAVSTEQLPERVQQVLNRTLTARNEVYSLAIPLAVALELKELQHIDDHWDLSVYTQLAEQHADELRWIAEHPETKAIATDPIRLHAEQLHLAAQSDARAILDYYQFINHDEFAAADVAAQWGRYLRLKTAGPTARARLAQWETRNLNMAARIRQASAMKPGETLVVIVGAAHKPFLEQYLRQMMDVEILPFDSAYYPLPLTKQQPK